MSTTSSIEHRTLAKLDAQITYHLDELRKSLGLAELTPEFLEFLLREVEPSPFRDGKEPMDFGSFSIALDGKPLSDHQLEVFGQAGLLTAFNLVSSRRVVRECVLGWG